LTLVQAEEAYEANQPDFESEGSEYSSRYSRYSKKEP